MDRDDAVTPIARASDPRWQQARRIRKPLRDHLLNLSTDDIYKILAEASKGYSDARAIQHVLDQFPIPY